MVGGLRQLPRRHDIHAGYCNNVRPTLAVDSHDRAYVVDFLGRGIFGAIFIGTAIFMVPRLGAATVLALIVVGQMIGSLAFDHFGLFGVPQHAANPVRLAGAAFLVLGVTLVRF